MTNRLMMSVAVAALIAGTGFANAQGTGTSHEAPSAGGAVQQSAPSSATPMNRSDDSKLNRSEDTGKPAAKTTQSDEKMQPQGAKNQRAQDDIKAGQKTEKSAQDNMKGEKSKSMSSETNDNAKGAKMNSAQSKDGMPKDGLSKDGVNNAQSKPSTSSQTTGNAATSATAAPPAEKQTQIASAIKSEKIEETTNVNFELNVGTRVPTTVRFYPLSPLIVEIYPEWRGYEVIRVRGRYVIVRPQTHEIVYIIEG